VSGDASDTLTVLHSVNLLHAAKQFTLVPGKKGKPDTIKKRGYASEKYFRVEERPVANFAGLCAELDRLTRDPFAFIVRGAPLPDINRNHTRRLLHQDPETGDPPTFAAQARHWLLVDLDHLPAAALTDARTDPEGAIQYLIGRLPPEFADVSCWWQCSSSQGLPGTEDFLSAHLWYWCARLYSDDELTRWATFVNRNGKLIDGALFRAVQPHYVAAPLFCGLTDPLTRRCGVWHGLDDALELILPPADARSPDQISRGGHEPGLGVRAYLARIGGPDGFRQPIVSAVASHIAIHGSSADCEPLKQAIREAVDRADPGARSMFEVDRYKSDAHLDAVITWAREQHGDQPPKPWNPPVREPPDNLPEPPHARS
jgi:hypothetical protein